MNGYKVYPKESKKLVGKEPCPKCGSRDNLARWEDGHAHCFSQGCGYHERADSERNEGMLDVIDIDYTNTTRLPDTAVFSSIKDRKISDEICRKYGVKVDKDREGNITKHYYPYYSKLGLSKEVVAFKTRNVQDKKFYATGEMRASGLFGQQLFENIDGGKYITVTEGELDCLSVAEMFEGKWPVVSLKNGSASAVQGIKESLEFLESFENIVLCFDQDDAGQKAISEVVDLFSPNKVKIMEMPLKDASDMLMARRVRDFMRCFWDAKSYKPVGIVSPATDESCWESFVTRGTEEVIPFPSAFGKLNAMMNGGMAASEITTLGALTSIGKSTVLYNLVYGMAQESNKKIGCVFLEASKGETIEKLLSVHVCSNISNIPTNERDYSEYRKQYDELFAGDKLHILDHQGSVDSDELFSKMRYLVKGLDCEVLVLDPLQAAVPNKNEAIDDFMDRCLKLVQETGVCLIIVSHMRKPFVKEAHDVSEYDLKGSGSINQISYNTILLSRDKMSDDEYTKNCTKVQLVKCRRTGNTGEAGWLYYNQETSRLERGIAPALKEVEESEF